MPGFVRLKRMAVLSFFPLIAVAIVIGFFNSCDNPFANNMGDKVTIGDARIFNVSPATASFIRGRAEISGDAWAHRELRRIEVRITGDGFAENNIPIPAPNEWTDITSLGGSVDRTAAPDDGINARWRFTIDTENYRGGGIALPDGRIRIQFRTADNIGFSETIETVYTVKNEPSTIRFTFPRNNDVLAGEPILLASGAEIRGDVADLVGLAPGYPMIQIWPRLSDGDDPEYGWASMFLFAPSSVPQINDNINANNNETTRGYDWRFRQDDPETESEDSDPPLPITVNFANFTFRLGRYMVEETRDDNVRPARFDGGLGSGEYYFRIISKDTMGGIGYFPKDGPVAIRVTENFDPPSVAIYNTPEELAAERPHAFITEATSRIIAIDDAPGSDMRPDRPIFRLRTLATHSDGIGTATLRWEHPATGRSGILDLDGNAGGTQGTLYNPANPSDRRAVLFTFTADGAHRDIFTTHPGAYILTFTVGTVAWQLGSDTNAVRTFNLFMDGAGPRVEIRPSIRGAVGSPDGDAKTRYGGSVNDNPITVNGNIQISIDRSAAFAIQTDWAGDSERQLVKWFVESAGEANLDDPLSGGGMLNHLVKFRNNPSHENLEFFRNIDDTHRSGWVNAPLSDHTLPEAYRTHHFKFDASRYDGQDLWLYVIAMDGVNNLGFAMQRLRVNEATDIPGITLLGLFAENASGIPIDGIARLGVDVGDNQQLVFGNNWASGSPRRNILRRNQGMELVLYDDDGIDWGSETDVRITLTDMNLDSPVSMPVNHLQISPAGNPREWMATLTQPMMAGAIGHGSHLRDGFYRIDITVYDGAEHKVKIEGTGTVRRSNSVRYYFAVHSHTPKITVSPRNDSLQPAPEPIAITGTVRSRFPVQRLWISFFPNVLQGQGSSVEHRPLKLLPVKDCTNEGDGECVCDFLDSGFYVYSWAVENVRLNPNPLPNVTGPAAELRNFSVRAFDFLAFDTNVPHRVQVDATPPAISLVSFDQGRPARELANGGVAYDVWGNVHFRINVTDTHGLIGPTSTLPDSQQPRLNVWWWLLPQGADLPVWNDSTETWNTPPVQGRGGQFYYFPSANVNPHTYHNVVLDAVFDSRELSGEHKLYVAARDAAGNWSNWHNPEGGILVERIGLNAGEDYPTLDPGKIAPAAPFGNERETVLRPDRGSLHIVGVARDTDGFPGSVGSRVDDYVQIRFTSDGDTWGEWIDLAAVMDPTGALDFTFEFYDSSDLQSGDFHQMIPADLRGDGLVRYQIRVTDHPTVANEHALTTRNKNPQDGLLHRFGTQDIFYPHSVPPSVSSVSRVFPLDDPGDHRTYFSFIFDETPPEIAFATANAITPTFSNVDGLIRDLRGTVWEENLLSFSISLGPGAPLSLLAHVTDEGEWNLEAVRDRIEEWWEGLGQGSRNVMLVAEDRAGNIGRGSWNFIRDTQGPSISFINISRAIDHGRIPGANEFPVNWPSDWPHGDGWRVWPEAWRNTIAAWPSDFAFLEIGEIRSRIGDEMRRAEAPTVITEREIRGSFDDLLGFIFDTPDGLANFYYRIPGGGRGTSLASDIDSWIPLWVEHHSDRGQSLSSALWAIPLTYLDDGLGSMDIKVRDTAGNWTELFGLRFILDTDAPEFLATGDDGGNWVPMPALGTLDHFTANWESGDWRTMMEHERVFSAVNAGTAPETVFELRGRVKDANLRDLSARIGSEGTDFVIARAWTGNPPIGDAGRDEERENENFPLGPSVADNRLGLERRDNGEWEWTLRIYERDIRALRNQANTTDGTRRLVSLVATDLANHRSATVQWSFYLDSKSPDIEFHNLQVVQGNDRNVFIPGPGVFLEGSATDDTGVRDVRFVIARWNYRHERWDWFNRDTVQWEERTFPDADDTRAVSAFFRDFSLSALDAPGGTDLTVTWRISADRFPGGYNPFTAEAQGRYKVYIRATDWSLAVAGSDMSITGNPNMPEGGGGRVFFVDAGPPTIDWEQSHDRLFFNGESLVRGFRFRVTDPNTVPTVNAVLRNGLGDQIGGSFGIDNPDPAWVTERTVTLLPQTNMIKFLTSGDMYTLEVTVGDAAGNITYMDNTVQFGFDDTDPALDVLTIITRPAQPVPPPGGHVALAGHVTIRGATVEEDSQIAEVQYTLIPLGEIDNFDPGVPVDFGIIRDDAWRSQGDFSWTVPIAGGDRVEVIRMEDNPSVGWTVNITNTRHIAGASAFVATYAPYFSLNDPRLPAIYWGEGSTLISNPGDSINKIHLVRLAIRARDEAGNVGFTHQDLWIFPDGDRPTVEIMTPYEGNEAKDNLFSGRFTLTGMARDNEYVDRVFFRIREAVESPPGSGNFVPGNAIRMRIPRFGDDGMALPAPAQNPITGLEIPGVDNRPDGSVENDFWYMASGGRGRDVFWSVPVNEDGELNLGTRGMNRIFVEVVAVDMTRDSPASEWSSVHQIASRPFRSEALVATGAPEFSPVRGSSVFRPAVGSIDDVHLGGKSGNATFSFDIRHEVGIAEIRYQRTSRVQGADGIFAREGGVIDLLAVPGGTDSHGGITVSATEPERDGDFYVSTVTVHVNTEEFTLAATANNLRFPIFISAADSSSPSPIVAQNNEFLRGLFIDNNSPNAGHEHNTIIAGSSAPLGGNAVDEGGIDRVIVWFQNRNGDGVSWSGFNREFVWGDQYYDNEPSSMPGRVTVPVPGGSREQPLPWIPAGNENRQIGNFAIVIDRNDPMGSQGLGHHGHRVNMGWAEGGLGRQLWNFTLDSTQLPSGHLVMHFVVFDSAGNASHFYEPILVMNNSPWIDTVQLATDLLGNYAGLSPGTDNLTGTDIFSTIRGHFPGNNWEADNETDIRSGISPAERPFTQAGLISQPDLSVAGARHRIGNFTARNNLLALSVRTMLEPHTSVSDRRFRVEYVTGVGQPIPATDVRRGGVYIIENAPGDVDWRVLGTQQRVAAGYAFLAVNPGSALPHSAGLGTATVRELTTAGLGFDTGTDTVTRPDTGGTTSLLLNEPVQRAEFAFRRDAFEGGIQDYDHGASPWFDSYALFVVMVFDGPENDLFGDFTLLELRVNNNDQTEPFAQLHDLNPAAEIVDAIGATPENVTSSDTAAWQRVGDTIAPMGIHRNRTMGGLWRNDSGGNLSRPGNIEPRRMEFDDGGTTGANRLGFPYSTYFHSLSPAEMNPHRDPFTSVNPNAFFAVDTVSGRVVLRGYAEDDQRIGSIELEFNAVSPDAQTVIPEAERRVTILERVNWVHNANRPTGQTGLLRAARDDVFFVDTIDLYRHRVEWAFVWDTAQIPAGFVVGNLNVRVIAYNDRAQDDDIPSPEMIWGNRDNDSATAMRLENSDNVFDPNVRNPGFPGNLYRYNSINMHVRPYITGFRRNLDLGFGNTRSLQGRYAFHRGEGVVVTGFNLGGSGTTATNVVLNTRANATTVITGAVTRSLVSTTELGAGIVNNFAISGTATADRFRHFVIPAEAVTGDGIMELRVTRGANLVWGAVNNDTRDGDLATGGARPGNLNQTQTNYTPRMINNGWWAQPWNTEWSTGTEGSDLWDNVTAVHVWQSNNHGITTGTGSNEDRGGFATSGNASTPWMIHGASMSIDPRNGMLLSSHNEGGSALGGGTGGSNNNGFTRVSRNAGDNTSAGWATNANAGGTGGISSGGRVTQFVDPVIHSSIFVNNLGQPWVASSVIGRWSNDQSWNHLIGVLVHGPGGGTMTNITGDHYAVESQWYNASLQNHFLYPSGWADGQVAPANEQFRNPRVVTHRHGAAANDERIHVAYFDSVTGAIKYRFNIRSQPGGTAFGLGSVSTTSGQPPSPLVSGTHLTAANAARNVRRLWTTLDGRLDEDDRYGSGTSSAWLTDNLQARLNVRDARVVPGGETGNAGNFEAGLLRSTGVGEHNDIAVTSAGFPVIVYYDAASERLRIAVSNDVMPVEGVNWSVFEVFNGTHRNNPRAHGTGQYVSMSIDTATADNIVHIAAFNGVHNNLVYVRGRVLNDGNTNASWQFDHAVVVDSVGRNVGRRSTISLDRHGNPWISYFDQGMIGGTDGVKVASFNPDVFGTRNDGNRLLEDIYGRDGSCGDLTGWETMHVPAAFRVVDVNHELWGSRLGMENFPTRNVAPNATTPARFWSAAVGYLSTDRYRIAYWVE